MNLPNYAKLIRVKQWVKNGFVFAPLVFSGQFQNWAAVSNVLIATIYFCLTASMIYVFNDIRDIDNDRAHSTKSKSRPLASGAVTLKEAWVLIALLALTISTCLIWNTGVFLVLLAYAALNVLYSVSLKNVPVVDIFLVAFGFPLRVFAGALAIPVALSHWMLVTIFALSLFLASKKRQSELLAQSGQGSRPVLKKYTEQVVNQYVLVSAMASLIFYCLFVLTVRNELVLTVPIVLFGFFRYFYVTDKVGSAESPTDALLTDLPLMATVLVWVLVVMVLIGGVF